MTTTGYEAGAAIRGGEVVHAIRDHGYSICGVKVERTGEPFTPGMPFACERCLRGMVVHPPAERAREDVEALKADWLSDPQWDIEHTEGFEAHREELAAFARATEAQWNAARDAASRAYAAQIGLPDNPTLAEYIRRLELRVAALEAQLDASHA